MPIVFPFWQKKVGFGSSIAIFSLEPFTITEDYAKRLNARKETFRAVTRTRKSLHTTLITTYGVKRNKHSQVVQKEVVLDDLFNDIPGIK